MWLALAATAGWAALLLRPWPDTEWRLLPVLELARYGCWLFALPSLIQSPGSAWLSRLNLLFWLLSAGLIFLSPVLAVLVLAVAGLMSIEQLLRNSADHERRGIKLCVVGFGGIFAWDLFFFSEYALFRAPDMQVWALRGFVNAAMLPVVLLGMSRLGKSAPTLFVSRQAIFFSTAFVAVGIYLVAMALAAQYFGANASAGASWLRPLLLIGAGIVLAALLTSESPWRRLRVFLAKHFYRNKYDYRVEWMRFVATLEGHGETDARTTSIRAIAQILESPGSVLFLRDEGSDLYSPTSTWFAEPQSPEEFQPLAPDHDLIRFMAEKEWVVDLDEYRRSPGVYRSIQLPTFLTRKGAAWRIVSPLLRGDNLQGFIALQRPPEPFTMTYEDRDLLRMAGRHVATLLAQQAADQRLAEGRQFDAFNRFAAFVMHDLKNSVAQLQLLTSNAARHRHNPEFIDDAFITIENTAARILRLIAQLQSRELSAGQREIDAGKILQTAVGRCSGHAPSPLIEMPTRNLCVLADPERLAAVFEHVLRNAQQAAGPTGEVRVRMERTVDRIAVTIADTGPGMDPDFIRDRLFRPFDSTKGASGMGVGAYQARAYVLELGGTVEVRSAPGSGTRFIIRIPLCRNETSSAS
ncbi:MAG: PEP-CTERM system histidine kinase PrsK [Pseudomonadota bacterium]|nr:PEP-CTERM system histidine kinase PrsK [Pseudomonadota bacterium]